MAQSITPAIIWKSVKRLISLTDFVCHIFIICGTNPKLVRAAATAPKAYQATSFMVIC